MYRIREISPEEHVNILSDLVITMASSMPRLMATLRFAIENGNDYIALSKLGKYGEDINQAFNRYMNRMSGIRIEVPEEHAHIPFVYKSRGGNIVPITRNPPVKFGVTRKLVEAGYECLKDLDGITLGEIACMPYFGPSHLKYLLAFLEEQGLVERQNVQQQIS